MTDNDTHAHLAASHAAFQRSRRRAFGIAYRMLGSVTAEGITRLLWVMSPDKLRHVANVGA
ncbi:hypothetical protein [Microbacterium yannicii]|uniref:hypothetical protein n=1 Tax=Microbacterium yannicii TaxID=671622 RepID=UPI00031242AF|nr:hypothetical protein [Microbacterium yannicii]